MAASESIQHCVTAILSDDLQLAVPDVDTDLFEEGVLDSLVFVDLISRLENEFGVEIDLCELEFDDFSSIRRIAGYVETHGGIISPEYSQPAHH